MKARVTWEVDIDDEDIKTAKQAAEYALNLIQRQDTTANVFTVKEKGKKSVEVDLLLDSITPVGTLRRHN